jgi:hypothetical protein
MKNDLLETATHHGSEREGSWWDLKTTTQQLLRKMQNWKARLMILTLILKGRETSPKGQLR